MACRLFGAKPLPKPMLTYCEFHMFQWASNKNEIILIQENAFKNVVCKMAAILFRPQCIKFINPQIAGMHGCTLCTAATDALVLKHQAISILSADEIFKVLDQIGYKYYNYRG